MITIRRLNKKLAKIKRLRKRRKLFEDYIEFTKERIKIIDTKIFHLLISKEKRIK